MKSNTRREKTHSKSTLTAVVGIAVLMLTVGLTATATARAAPTLGGSSGSSGPGVNTLLAQYAEGSHTIIVRPNGHDDTADIQAAFNACTSSRSPCTVQLEKGTYYTAQVTVYGFQGSFVGMGQGVTIIQALPNLPSPTADPFWAALPGPANPWPALFTFENGAYMISGMTLTEPYYDAVYPAWDASLVGGLATEDNLFDVMELTGLQAFATVDHVTVLGAAGDFLGTNMGAGITYEGTVLPPGWTNPLTDPIPITGSLSVTNSLFNSVEDGPWVDTIVNTEVTVCYNTITNSPVPLGFFDASNSQLLYCGNQASNVYYGEGVLGEQSVYKTNQPSTVYIMGNDFQVNQGAGAVGLIDFGPSEGLASTLNAVVSGNVVQTDTSYCVQPPYCYVGSEPAEYSVIISYDLKSLVVSGNTILGGGSAGVYVVGGPAVVIGNTILGSYAGVWVDYANHVQVLSNVIKNSAEYGISVTDGSSYNLVAGNVVKNSGVDDLYWDGTGTGNVWIGNIFGTSSPPGL
jgi:parallel beta-helix repeat protein